MSRRHEHPRSRARISKQPRFLVDAGKLEAGL